MDEHQSNDIREGYPANLGLRSATYKRIITAVGSRRKVSFWLGCDQRQSIYHFLRDRGNHHTSSLERIEATLNDMNSRMRELVPISPSQSIILVDELKLSKDKAQALTNENLDRATTGQDLNSSMDTNLEDVRQDCPDGNSFQNAINRLTALATENDKTVFSDDAECIIDDVNQMLNSVEVRQSSAGQSTVRLKRPYCDDLAEQQVLDARQIKKIRRLLATSEAISLTSQGKFPLLGLDV